MCLAFFPLGMNDFVILNRQNEGVLLSALSAVLYRVKRKFFCSPEALTAVDFSLFNKYNQNRGYPSVAEAGNQHMHSWSSPNQCRPLEMFVSGDLLLSLLLL